MLTIKAIAAWRDIMGSTVLSQSESGVLYWVPNLGRVWVGPDNVRESMTARPDAQCVLITCNDKLPEERVWAILSF